MWFFRKHKTPDRNRSTHSNQTTRQATLARLRPLRCEPLEDRRMLSITLFVDDDATAGGDGLGWGTAYNNLQSALTQAAAFNTDADTTNDVDQIWIAEGTYYPSAELEPGDARSASFSLIDGVSLYGGFIGTETLLDERNLSAGHTTTLSGDLGVPSETSDNVYSVVYCGENVETAVNGISITGGKSFGGFTGYTVGAGIHNNGDLNITNVSISGNWAIRGGGIYNKGNLTIMNSMISDNYARDEGGGIYNNGHSGNAIIAITNSTISGNSAGYGKGGGGIYNVSNEGIATIMIANSTISNNQANLGNEVTGGGGICNFNVGGIARVAVIDSIILENTAVAGGGIYNYNGNLTVVKSVFVNNTANDSGGGIFYLSTIYDLGTMTVDSSVFSNNRAESWGGGGIYSESTHLTITNTTFSENVAGSKGGGICNYQSELNVMNSTLLNNSAIFGGGICNMAGIYGGAKTSVHNSTISGNLASNNGGGIISSGSALTLILNNTIVAGNVAPRGTDLASAAGKVSGFYNLIGNGMDQSTFINGVNGNLVGTAAAPIGPKLDTLGRPLSGSLAINAGSNDLIPDNTITDLDGNYRIANSTVDIGAYEFGSTPLLAGDVNCDGKVDGSDVTILAGNWQAGVGGGQTATWSMGDFNGDGKVDGSDVTILAGNWQAGVSSTVVAVSEPEQEDEPEEETTRFVPPANGSLGVAMVPRRESLPARRFIKPTSEVTDAVLTEVAWSESDYTAVAKDLVVVSVKKSATASDELFTAELDSYADFD